LVFRCAQRVPRHIVSPFASHLYSPLRSSRWVRARSRRVLNVLPLSCPSNRPRGRCRTSSSPRQVEANRTVGAVAGQRDDHERGHCRRR
jgi:hypothetical protein